MSERQKPRGLPLPSLWHVALIVAVPCGAWLLWSETRDRVISPQRGAGQGNSIERIREVEALVERGTAAVPDLLALATSADPKSRCDGLLGLGRLGSQAQASLDAVRERLSDAEPRVRASALSAFSQVCQADGGVATGAVQPV